MSNPTETDHQSGTTGRALVPIARHAEVGNDERPSASFVTQLIASNRRLPAYRRSCRTDAGSAITLYGADRPRTRASLDFVV